MYYRLTGLRSWYLLKVSILIFLDIISLVWWKIKEHWDMILVIIFWHLTYFIIGVTPNSLCFLTKLLIFRFIFGTTHDDLRIKDKFRCYFFAVRYFYVFVWTLLMMPHPCFTWFMIKFYDSEVFKRWFFSRLAKYVSNLIYFQVLVICRYILQ